MLEGARMNTEPSIRELTEDIGLDARNKHWPLGSVRHCGRICVLNLRVVE
jgi:hypothetical protein